MFSGAHKLELLHIADAVAREKSIDRNVVLSAMESAIEKAAVSAHGTETEIKADIDIKTGELRLRRMLTIVEELENPSTQILLTDARMRNPGAQVGDILSDPLPPMNFGRVAVQAAKQVIIQSVREAERDRQYEEFKNKLGEIVNGFVKSIEYEHVIVDFHRGEGVIRRDQLIPREVFRAGDRVRAYVCDVRREPRGQQVFLSRTHPQFLLKLFVQEVSEIYDGIVEIKAVARDPGSQAKVAVVSKDSSIDPVGACVGMRGSRVQAVANELQGEKIDIVPWSPDEATFLANALRPAELSKIIIDEGEDRRVDVVVSEDQLSVAIGKRGQNVRLASQLTGLGINLLTEEEDSKQRASAFSARTNLFTSAINVDEVVAQLLIAGGFTCVEDLASVDPSVIADIEGFDEETAAEINSRANEYLKSSEGKEELGDSVVHGELSEVSGVTPVVATALRCAGVNSLEELAGCDLTDLLGYTEEQSDGEHNRVSGYLDGCGLTETEVAEIITAARVRAGWI